MPKTLKGGRSREKEQQGRPRSNLHDQAVTAVMTAEASRKSTIPADQVLRLGLQEARNPYWPLVAPTVGPTEHIA